MPFMMAKMMTVQMAMRTTGMMGEVVGMAASLALKHATTPRGVYMEHLDELKELMGTSIGKSRYLPSMPPRD